MTPTKLYFVRSITSERFKCIRKSNFDLYVTQEGASGRPPNQCLFPIANANIALFDLFQNCHLCLQPPPLNLDKQPQKPPQLPPPPPLMLQDQDSVMGSQMDSILTLKIPTNIITVLEAILTRKTVAQALCFMTAVNAVAGLKKKRNR